jgi:hypothetical protein
MDRRRKIRQLHWPKSELWFNSISLVVGNYHELPPKGAGVSMRSLATSLMLFGALRLRSLGGALVLGIAAPLFLLAVAPQSAFPAVLESVAAALTLAGT